MKDYIILPTLTGEGRKTVKEYPQRIQQVNIALAHWEVNIEKPYALLGSYDFLTIVQARDNELVMKTALEIGARGAVHTMTIPAIPIDGFIKEIQSGL